MKQTNPKDKMIEEVLKEFDKQYYIKNPKPNMTFYNKRLIEVALSKLNKEIEELKKLIKLLGDTVERQEDEIRILSRFETERVKKLKHQLQTKEDDIFKEIDKELNRFRDKDSLNRYDKEWRDDMGGLQEVKKIIRKHLKKQNKEE